MTECALIKVFKFKQSLSLFLMSGCECHLFDHFNFDSCQGG